MLYLCGTSGFSYPQWKGSFYPEKIAPDAMLRYYAQRLPALEIDNTFYRLPRESVLAGWAEQVAGEFRFSLKASRRITHFKRLKDAEDETEYLLRVAQTLGPKLGAILFQLPPNMQKDRDRLARFLDLLPAPVPAVFEFRSPGWFEPDIHDLLRERGRPLCIVDRDEEEEEGGSDVLPATAPWGYLRLRRDAYDDAALRDWERRIAATGWNRAFVFFKHEDAGTAPALARRFLQLAGQEPETALAAAAGLAAPRAPAEATEAEVAPARKTSHDSSPAGIVSPLARAGTARKGPQKSPTTARARDREKRA